MTAPPMDDPGLRSHPGFADQVPGAAAATTAAPEAPALPLPAVEPQAAQNPAGPFWIRLLPSMLMACVLSIAITVPSYWRDEAATVAAVSRPFGQMLRMLGQIDAVHSLYYMLIWPISALFGTGELVLRLPSVIAMSIAAGVVAATARRLVSPGAGLAAGLIFVAVPSISVYGQMARSYALVILAAAVASYALVRALEGDAGPARWRWYAASLAVLGMLNIFGLLLIPAHGVTALLAQRGRERNFGPGLAWLRALLPPRRWLAAACFALLLTSPLLVMGYLQRSQISWVTQPALGSLRNVAELMGPLEMSVAILAIAVIGFAALLARRGPARLAGGSARSPRSAAAGVLALCLPWLVLPATLLLLASVLVTPVYTLRYILFCIPAGAIVAGTGLAGIASITRWRAIGALAATAALVQVAALGYSQQVRYRTPSGHSDNIREANKLIAASWHPGDAVVYTAPSVMDLGSAYRGGLGWLSAVQVAEPAIPSGTLAGTNVPSPVLRQRLADVHRFWVVQVDGIKQQTGLLYGLHFRQAWAWHTSNIWLQLYVPSRIPWGTGHFEYHPHTGPPWYTRRVE